MIRSLPNRMRPSVTLMGILTIAASLRLWRVASHSLWLDEAFSILAASRPLSETMRMLADCSAQPLYHAILHYWIGWGGMEEAHVVRLSAVLGLLLVGLVYGVGTVCFTRPVGEFAGLLTALSPIHLFYSRQVRMYGLLALVSLAAVTALERACERGRRIDWFAYAALTAAAMYTHLYGLFIPIIAAALVWTRRRDRTTVRRALFSHLGILAVYAPWLPSLWQQVSGHHTPHLSRPTPIDVLRSFYYFSFGQPLSVAATPHAIRWALCLITSALLVLGFRAVWRKRPVWGLYLILPLGLAYLVSLVRPAYVAGRYDMMVFPVWTLLVAAGLTAVRPLTLRWSVGAVVIGLTLWPLSLYTQSIADDTPRNDIADLIVRRGEEGDVVIFTGLSRPPIQYYLEKTKRPLVLHSYPREMERHMAWIDRERLITHPNVLVQDAETLLKQVERELPPDGRVWLVYSHPDVSDTLRLRLDARMAMTVMARQGELNYPVFAYRRKDE